MPEPTGDSDAPAILGTTGAALALVGSGLPVRSGSQEPVSLVLLGVTALAIAVVFARRREWIARRPGAILTAIAGLAIIPLVVLVHTTGSSPAVGIPFIGPVPVVGAAAMGAPVLVAGAAADWARLTGRGIIERTVATSSYGVVGVFGYVLILLWVIVLLSVYTTVTGSGTSTLGVVGGAALEQAATVLGVGMTVGIFLSYTGRDRTFIDISVPSVTDIVAVVLGVVAIFGAAIGISVLLDALQTESATHGAVDMASNNPEVLLVLVPASIFVVGPFEELLFRNVVQKPLYEYFSKPGAVVAASVPFALIHFSAYGSGTMSEILTSLSVVLLLSLLLGTLYAYTENLLVPALVHGIYNAVLFLNLYFVLTA